MAGKIDGVPSRCQSMSNRFFRIVRSSIPVILSLATVLGCARSPETPRMFEHECVSKSGFGVINPDLHIVLRSDRNELLVSSVRWKGASRFMPQRVLVRHGAVVAEGNELPSSLRADDVVVSFKRARVYFHDFRGHTGCYYERQ